MIREVFYMGREQVAKNVNTLSPPAVLNNFYAGINIYESGRKPIALPPYIKPIMQLEYNPCALSRRYNFTDFMAERTFTFLQHLDASDSRFILFCISDRGRNRAAAIAQFLKTIKPEILTKGLSEDTFKYADQVTKDKLFAQWTIAFNKEQAAPPKLTNYTGLK
jgi:hypothetical protein